MKSTIRNLMGTLALFALCHIFILNPLHAQDELEEFRRNMEENLAFLNYDLGVFQEAIRTIDRKGVADAETFATIGKNFDFLKQEVSFVDRAFQNFRVESIMSYSTNRTFDQSVRNNLDLKYRKLARDFFQFSKDLSQFTPLEIRSKGLIESADLAGETMVGKTPGTFTVTPDKPVIRTSGGKGQTPDADALMKDLIARGIFTASDFVIEDGTTWQLKGDLFMEASHFKVDGDKDKFEQDNYGFFSRDNGKFQLNMDFNELPKSEATGVTFGQLHIDTVTQDTLGETVNLKFGGEQFTIQVGSKLLPSLSEFSLNNLEIGALMGDMKLKDKFHVGAFAGNINEDAAPNIPQIDRRVHGGTLGYDIGKKTRANAIYSEARDIEVAALTLNHQFQNSDSVGFEMANSNDKNASKLKGDAYRFLFSATRNQLVLDGEYLNLDDDFRTQGNPEYASRLSDLQQTTLNANYRWSKNIQAIGQYIHGEEANDRAPLRISTDSDDASILLLYTAPKAPQITLLIKKTTKDGSDVTLGSIDQTTDFSLLKVSKKFGVHEGEVSYTSVDFDGGGSAATPVNFQLKNPALKWTSQWNNRWWTYANLSHQKTTGTTENTLKFLETKAELKLGEFRKVFSRYAERRLESPITTNRTKREMEFGYEHKPRENYTVSYAIQFVKNEEQGADYEGTGGVVQVRRKF